MIPAYKKLDNNTNVPYSTHVENRIMNYKLNKCYGYVNEHKLLSNIFIQNIPDLMYM